VEEKLKENVSVKDFNATGDGTTNDASAIQTALDSGSGYITVPGGTYNIGTAGIRIPPSVHGFIMREDATLLYRGKNVAVLIDGGPYGAAYTIAIRRVTAEWDTGEDSSSIGIQFRNVEFSKLTANMVSNFHTGIQMLGDAKGCVENQLYLNLINDNQIGLHLLSKNKGWSNQNLILGGGISISSSHKARLPGTIYVRLDPGTNGNTFINTDLENGQAERTLDVYGSGNIFENLRFEANGPGSIVFHQGADYNIMLGGYFSSGTFDNVVDDDGLANLFFGFAQLAVTSPANPKHRTPLR
jgi:hypothetical protein